MKKNKILAGLMALAFCVPMALPVAADGNPPIRAEVSYTIDGVEYSMITYYDCTDDDDEFIVSDGVIYEVYRLGDGGNFSYYADAWDVVDRETVTSVTIPDEIDGYPVNKINIPFWDCPNLEEINVVGDFENAFYSYYSEDGVLYGEGGAYVWLLSYPPAKEGEYVVPENVTRVHDEAFVNCSALTKVTFHDGTWKDEGEYRFFNCTSLESIDEISGAKCLYLLNCPSLKYVDFAYSGTLVKLNVLLVYDCPSLDSLYIPTDESKIYYIWAFSECPALESFKQKFSEAYEEYLLRIAGTTTEAADSYLQAAEISASVEVEDEVIVQGDANGDGKFSVTDVVMMQRYLSGSTTLTNWQNVDYNNDGVVNVFDMVLMKRALLEQS